MKLKPIRDHLLAYPGASEGTPFGPDVLVYKVCGKMFALVGWQNLPVTINLKCDPEHSIELREQHQAIEPGYHMNKRHWITLTLDSSLSEQLVFGLVQDSYALIVSNLPKRLRAELENQ